jgi:3-demethoxyubiquinol 3-hydroxylase
MNDRTLTPLDRVLTGINRSLSGLGGARASRPSPADGIPDETLTASERRHAAGLMRVNHSGEIAAQGLYHGHALVSRDPGTRTQMTQAADEEMDHLGWCEERLGQLEAGPSRLSPLWYAGSFAIGAASGILGDRWALGFVEETERQVSEHLQGHLRDLPSRDRRSRAIVKQMQAEEQAHGAAARAAGALELPGPVRGLMRVTARIMTRTAYWI